MSSERIRGTDQARVDKEKSVYRNTTHKKKTKKKSLTRFLASIRPGPWIYRRRVGSSLPPRISSLGWIHFSSLKSSPSSQTVSTQRTHSNSVHVCNSLLNASFVPISKHLRDVREKLKKGEKWPYATPWLFLQPHGCIEKPIYNNSLQWYFQLPAGAALLALSFFLACCYFVPWLVRVGWEKIRK